MRFRPPPLIDNGLSRRAHQRGQLHLTQPPRATRRANLHAVVLWHARPGNGCRRSAGSNVNAVAKSPAREGKASDDTEQLTEAEFGR